jgi:indole-3-glycerol phosphate synthase
VTGVLADIVAATRKDLAARTATRPAAALERLARERVPSPGGFLAALSRAGRLNVVAECKRRSPSRGLLRAGYDPVALARAYEQGGAAAVSVLTEPRFFGGSLEHLAAVRDATTLPLLRKDFVVSEYQLLEARAAGADAVLLIAAALDASRLAQLVAAARALHLAPLVEVHDEAELERALEAGATSVGVNSRDLRSLSVDLAIAERLGPLIPTPVVAVAESGLRTRDDLVRLRDAGYSAFLVGEQLVTSVEPASALRTLAGDPS